MIFAFCTGDSLGSAALDADITKYTYGKAVNRGYSTIQVARMLGVDEQTLLSLLEVSCNPGRRRHRQRKSLSSGLSSENSVFTVPVVQPL